MEWLPVPLKQCKQLLMPKAYPQLATRREPHATNATGNRENAEIHKQPMTRTDHFELSWTSIIVSRPLNKIGPSGEKGNWILILWNFRAGEYWNITKLSCWRILQLPIICLRDANYLVEEDASGWRKRDIWMGSIWCHRSSGRSTSRCWDLFEISRSSQD